MPNNLPITKAVIAAAGFGTRFLPQTKAMPKEMLPLIDKPIIQYVVEELVEAGIKDIIIISGYNKRSIEDHFDTPNQDLVANLQSGGPQKEPLLREVEAIADLANFIYIRQKGPYGNATPVACAAHLLCTAAAFSCHRIFNLYLDSGIILDGRIHRPAFGRCRRPQSVCGMPASRTSLTVERTSSRK